ncbi:ATP-dependent RecD-like DNA helicase [Streptococcus macacae]|uniref:ATP-dependent RecD2 DNA helicase n=1 Tax=Streptococcus macacae NCTC 11558 TaxID=764298 RepID=G5JXH8_9STRE|nr:ATP-dependent RecD-like DNA helicase [Streptococcus macacae]EHJ52255.1 helicase, RecD/TraA family [Streptococcus macacae NCTC 11558]SUN79251.1 exodeoxyribonuclease V [Streptococcus macacae NCTC 11558]
MTYYFSGTIERLIFENSSNFFKIILLEIDDTDSGFEEAEIIVTGTIAEVIEGESYTFWGELIQHPKYGEQLKAERYERAKPSSTGLIKYFSGKHFKGIGQKTAEKIVQVYGDNPIDKILENPDKLDTISGLSQNKKEEFVQKLRLNYGTEQILAKLAKYGLTNKLAFQIYDHYREESLNIIKDNPYQLVEDIQGIGFKIADQLAEQIGIKSDAKERFRAALLHTLLETSLDKGDTYIEAKELLERAIELLEDARQVELEANQVAQELTQLIKEDKVQNIETKIFDNSLFYAEAGIQKNLSRLLQQKLEKNFDTKTIQAEIKQLQQKFKLTYDNVQKEAIQKAIQSKIFLLTGGPGTGKTTVINGIIETYASLHNIDLNQKDCPIILAAPTGRAARRMHELTGLSSATIHRHLGLNGDSDYQTIDDYLDCDLIIIDEFSMVDTWLANQLFNAIATHTQVIIVGDSDQLPSVGPGQVLADLLKVPQLTQVSLSKIFRQSEDSTIVTLASEIKQGYLPDDFTAKKADRSYFEAQSSHIPQMVEQIVSSAIRNGIDAQEIQILAPMYRGQAGIDHLNHLMQELLNPLKDRTEFQFNNIHFRKADKILHLVNDAELNIFNGDIGYITDLIPAKDTESKQDEMIIDFDGAEILYPRSEWNKITLAYAMSIHKSQGSEFKVVILPITRQGGRLLKRNLIYTAITRSKSKLIMLGELTAFELAVKNEATSRKTYLVERFTSVVSENSSKHKIEPDQETAGENATYILRENNIFDINPMIGITQTDIDYFFKK